MPKLVYTNKKGLHQKKGSGVDWSGSTVQGKFREVIAHSAGTTALLANNSGCIVMVTANDSGGKVTLPAVADAEGMWFDLVVQTAIANDLVIEANGSDEQVLIATSANNATAVTTGDDITLEADADVAGDRCRWYCDGSKWYADAMSTAAATFAAA